MAGSSGPIIDEGQGLILAGRYRLEPGVRLPELSRPDATACAVEDRLGAADECYALLCTPETFVRHDVLAVLMDKPVRRIRCPLATGTVRLQDGKVVLAVVLGNRKARRLLAVLEPGPVKETVLIQQVMPGLAAAVAELAQRNITHRSIRPETMLVDDKGEVMLDQCVVGLPAEHQPPAYEPIPSQSAPPAGRGEGTAVDDVYAATVATLQLISGERPGADLSDQELLALKVLRGSYDALLRRRKFATGLQTLFAGGLTDDPEKRWGAEQLTRWASGVWDMPRPSTGGRRATRTFLFRNVEYQSPMLLAWALHRHPDEALGHIVTERLEKWMRNVLNDDQGADIIRDGLAAYQASRSQGAFERAELVSRACMALDPGGPVRFRSIVASASGLANTLWRAFRDKDRKAQDELLELFASGILDDWLTIGGRFVRAGLPATLVSQLRWIARNPKRRGMGLERILYEMLPRLHCLSPDLVAAMARTPGEVMAALDARAVNDPQGGFVIDRHAGCFLAAHDRALERGLRMMDGGAESGAGGLVVVARFLADLQRMHHPWPVPGLTRAFAATLKPAAGDVRSRVRRMVIEKKVDSLAKRGDLVALLTELNLDAELGRDAQEFARAVAEHERLERLIAELSEFGPRQKALAMRRGYRYARLFSYSIAFLTVFYFTMETML
ncbi:MAG: hypothetical protein VYB54_09415 [Pseudomonadota bacterium]|nr:hypothetical protein [Pseudomonadota bacterium]